MQKYASIQQLEGGYIVTTDHSTQIVTSLNKAIKLVREYLGEADTETAAE